jgi:hypothetical protein
VRRPSNSPRLQPQRSQAAIILALTLSAVFLVCAVVMLDAAGPARESAKANLLAGDDDFGVNYLPELEAAVNLEFVYPAVLCLFLATALAALAFASRSGPRWSIITLGVLCELATVVFLYLAVVQLSVGLPGGGYAFGELTSWLKEAAPPWFAPTEGIPVLATVFGLPAIGVLLIIGHYNKPETAWPPTTGPTRSCSA